MVQIKINVDDRNTKPDTKDPNHNIASPVMEGKQHDNDQSLTCLHHNICRIEDLPLPPPKSVTWQSGYSQAPPPDLWSQIRFYLSTLNPLRYSGGVIISQRSVLINLWSNIGSSVGSNVNVLVLLFLSVWCFLFIRSVFRSSSLLGIKSRYFAWSLRFSHSKLGVD